MGQKGWGTFALCFWAGFRATHSLEAKERLQGEVSHWFHSQRSAGIPEFFPTTSAAHCSWSSTHKPTSDLHLMPNVPHFIIVTRATALQIVCQQQFVSVYSTNLGRAEENVRRGVTAPRTPPLLTFIFPKPISQILTVRTAKTIPGYSPWSQVCHSKLPTYFANTHHVGSSIAIFTVSERIFFLWALRKIAFCSKVATCQASNWSYFGVIQASKKRKHTPPKCFDYRNLCSGSKYLRRCLKDFSESWKKVTWKHTGQIKYEKYQTTGKIIYVRKRDFKTSESEFLTPSFLQRKKWIKLRNNFFSMDFFPISLFRNNSKELFSCKRRNF